MHLIAKHIDRDIPSAVQVGSFILARVKRAPMYVRALNQDVVLCVALTDDFRRWVGWVTARYEKDPDSVSATDVGTLCFCESDTLKGACDGLLRVMEVGISQSRQGAAGVSAIEKLRGEETY